MKNIYVAITATPCFTGRFIRAITNSSYNHVSICFEPTLKELYSFARRYKSTPFCGGFVKESSNRYRQKGRVAKLLLYRIPMTDVEYSEMADRLEIFMKNNREYVYNNLSAVMSLLHLRMQVKNSYTCVEFVTEQLSYLSSLGGVLKEKFYSIDSLKAALSDFLIYSGPFPTGSHGWGDDTFNHKLSVGRIIREEYTDNKKLLSNFIFTIYPGTQGKRAMRRVDEAYVSDNDKKTEKKRGGRAWER